jgi:formylglycine-generating enzyme required for sulfatase activity
VQNVDCVNVYKFCELLSQKTGHKVRYPTAAEWDYAARVGTSNPPFAVKFKQQPNAWGFYDIPGSSWERVGDGCASDYKDTVDPVHTPPQDRNEATRGQQHQQMGLGAGDYAIGEFEYINSGPGNFRFRVAVDAEGAAPAGAGAGEGH